MAISENAKSLLIKAVVGLVACLAIVFGAIYPEFLQSQALESERDAVQTDLLRQERFAPVYASLVERQARMQGVTLPLPEPGQVTARQLYALPEELTTLAEDNGLEVLDVVLGDGASAPGMRPTSDISRLQIVLAGTVAQFQAFYLGLGSLDWVDAVNRVEIRAVSGGVELFAEIGIVGGGQ